MARLGVRLGFGLALAIVVIWTHTVPAINLEGRPPSGAVRLDPASALAVTGGAEEAHPGQSSGDPVVLTVRALDRNHRPVTDLRQEDFVIIEDRVQQEIGHFSVLALEPGEAQPGGPALVTAATDPLKLQDHRLFVFVIGTGKLETGSKGITALCSFVETRLFPQDRVAVFAYGRALDFSTDHKRLSEVLERVRRQHEDVDFDLSLQMGETGMASLYGTRVLSRGLQSKVQQMLFGPGGRAPSNLTAEVLGHEEFAALSADDFHASTAVTARDEGNLAAILEYLRHFEGKKELLFVTENGLFWPTEETDRAFARLANEGRVSIHALQLGGILTSTQRMARSFGNLRNMSELTGGLASIMADGGGALENLDAVTRTGYVLSYQPSNKALDGRYRAVTVAVKRPDVTVLFPHGYLRERIPTGFNRLAFISNERLRAGGVFRREVDDIKVKASATVREGEVIVEGTIDIAKIKLQQEGDSHLGLLSVAVFCMDTALNGLGVHVMDLPVKVTAEELNKYRRNGMPYSIRVPLVRGMSSVRFIVYDFGSDLVGRVDRRLL